MNFMRNEIQLKKRPILYNWLKFDILIEREEQEIASMTLASWFLHHNIPSITSMYFYYNKFICLHYIVLIKTWNPLNYWVFEQCVISTILLITARESFLVFFVSSFNQKVFNQEIEKIFFSIVPSFSWSEMFTYQWLFFFLNRYFLLNRYWVD